MNKKHSLVRMVKAVSLVAILFVLGATDSQASSRSTKKFGLGVGLITEPFPSVVGFHAGYNLAKFLRLNFGYGTISDTANGIDATTIEFSAKLFPLDWSFAPFAVVGFTNVSGSVGAGNSTLSGSGSALSYGFGLDWQTGIGFNLGFDYKFVTLGGTTRGLPGGYIGWYF